MHSSMQLYDLMIFLTGRFLGLLCSYIIREIPNFPPEAEKPVTSLSKLFLFHLNSKSAVQRFVIAQVVYNLALSNKVHQYVHLSMYNFYFKLPFKIH